MDEDLQNFSPTVMFRGKPCDRTHSLKYKGFTPSGCKDIGIRKFQKGLNSFAYE